MHVLLCRWDEVVLRAALAVPDVEVSLVIDAWEAEHRALDAELIARTATYDVISSFTDLRALSSYAAALQVRGVQPAKVLSLSEFSQLGAAYLAAVLGLDEPRIPLSVLARDKSAMKAVARAAGLPCARLAPVTRRDTDGLTALGAELGWPLVIKPVDGMGTLDTWIFADAATAADRLAVVDAAADLVAEEYVRGPEYHLDAVWAGGEERQFGVARYPVPRVEITDPGHLNGSALLREREHAEIYAELREFSRRLNETFGITDAITHVEVFAHPERGWVFSEFATRPGGGGIPQTFAAFGADLRARWVRTELGDDPGPVGEPPTPLYGWGNFAPARAGRLVRVPDEDRLRAVPWVSDVIRGHEVGDEVALVFPSLWSWQVFFGAASWPEFCDRLLQLEELARFEVEPGEPVDLSP